MSAAGHFWNACLPLLDSRRDRRPLRGALELILKTISRTYSKHTAVRHHKHTPSPHEGLTMKTISHTYSKHTAVRHHKHTPSPHEGLTLKTISHTYSKHTAVRHHKHTLISNKHHHLTRSLTLKTISRTYSKTHSCKTPQTHTDLQQTPSPHEEFNTEDHQPHIQQTHSCKTPQTPLISSKHHHLTRV